MSYRLKRASELRQMSSEQLRERLREIAATQMQLRGFQKAGKEGS
jgi:ribosomal protein L29